MKYYCIGIKGSGMATLAEILFDLGNSVSGYDDYKPYKFTQDGLDKRCIKIYYDNEHEIDKDTIVTYSKAFSMDHPEIKRVKNLGLKIIAYNELLGKVTKNIPPALYNSDDYSDLRNVAVSAYEEIINNNSDIQETLDAAAQQANSITGRKIIK